MSVRVCGVAYEVVQVHMQFVPIAVAHAADVSKNVDDTETGEGWCSGCFSEPIRFSATWDRKSVCAPLGPMADAVTDPADVCERLYVRVCGYKDLYIHIYT